MPVATQEAVGLARAGECYDLEMRRRPAPSRTCWATATRWSSAGYRGTRGGDVPRLAATGRALAVTGMTIYQVEGGRVSAHWQETNRFGLMQQLGAYGLPAAG
jgi:hypothetical protein